MDNPSYLPAPLASCPDGHRLLPRQAEAASKSCQAPRPPPGVPASVEKDLHLPLPSLRPPTRSSMCPGLENPPCPGTFPSRLPALLHLPPVHPTRTPGPPPWRLTASRRWRKELTRLGRAPSKLGDSGRKLFSMSSLLSVEASFEPEGARSTVITFT
ncbi:E3 ubiquitin-protein ligase RNF220-like isoform X1 [Lates japonicus]|uniref:E3 ubiquitin-protein ligase RNF220-like isoform X1 n=1 Tax=Lates japonicus TaxID=270547 RepID=A0AAD3MS10_LATJO|nr:E3 ubiquitin-protein ligase RNF220-like isoform X1 [Lates japonicus]